MTVFAGIVARRAGDSLIPDAVISTFERHLSRRADDRPLLLREPGFAIAVLDFGEGTGRSVRRAPDSVTVVGGHPLIDRNPGLLSPGDDIDELDREWKVGATAALKRTRGAFCGIHIDARVPRIWMVPDKLALRPIYYAVLPDFTVFATSMRVLELCPLLPRTGNLRALAETASLGYALGNRTMLAAARVLEPGLIVEVSADGLREIEYWRWDDISPREATVDEMCNEIQDAFMDAVRLRLGARQRVVSLLSGGLDSRSIAVALRTLGAEVHTLSFGPKGSADQLLARRVSDALGTRHYELQRSIPTFWSRLHAVHADWRGGPGRDWPDSEANFLWSGEGGDRVLAPVNLNEDVIEAMRAEEPDSAIAAYMKYEHTTLPYRIFRRPVREAIRRLPRLGIRSELERQRHPDGGRRFHLYVFCNESRKNIKQHFEDLDLSQLELVMPFYDPVLMRVVLRYPIDPFIRHRLYNRWITRQSASVAGVPWQAYPESEPCPLALPEETLSQWSQWYTKEEERAAWRAQVALADELVRAHPFPHWIIRRVVLRAARLLMRAGVRRYGYLFDVARPFVLYPTAPGDFANGE